ncbi:hypothetical protein GQ55_2G098000 [Panicum hallii var. hallii]|uniref:Uncharacterized protein n=1 Tax=Panicum hallii var. hallii TaxID=1504633 RepID=A0A2T7ENA8_9POAL|nr:hypothetical protein GQ55_2G098000 [Panicum hallii var. hallii]
MGLNHPGFLFGPPNDQTYQICPFPLLPLFPKPSENNSRFSRRRIDASDDLVPSPPPLKQRSEPPRLSHFLPLSAALYSCPSPATV